MRIILEPRVNYKVKWIKDEFEHEFLDEANQIALKKGVPFIEECKYQSKNYPFFVKYLGMYADLEQDDSEEEFVGIDEIGEITIEL